MKLYTVAIIIAAAGSNLVAASTLGTGSAPTAGPATWQLMVGIGLFLCVVKPARRISSVLGRR